ncbi:DNA mismatch repair protein MutS [Capnocytophaga canimorsus]|uniref:endonuclease MutS2 n=1 Tax=Capnocytophaga canimorsus TaxID=28188 RepID=UPI000F4F32CA|nr:DNA mismatch repair protein MutS [Capnocytophaga canimorsus]AYW37953.1 DNA mismatch repair protein MutS [Capnocytophaga canimorsus]MDT9499166.1 DNA mismatch repair protein MutS [Capnocytophaga canimorsus]
MHTKTLQDLEFNTVLQHISELCQTELGKKYALRVEPFTQKEALLMALQQTNEYLSSFQNNNTIPPHAAEKIKNEIKLLEIEGTTLEITGIQKIYRLSQTVNNHIVFFHKFKELYPTLYQSTESIHFTNEITEAIEKIIDKFGEIKNEASPTLANIRKEISQVKGKINESFNRALAIYNASDYLDDIRETVVENRRVLAVKAMYRRKVQGAVLGSSKTGSIVYIEPQETERASRELNNLLYDEKEEILRILKELTIFLGNFVVLLKDYQAYITSIDIIYGKAKYAQKINGLLPEITEERVVDFRQAYHPLLFLNNQEKGAVTYPQTILLTNESRIIVISGPNAGGKSITLKTIGLLQLMLQSGMLIPVHHRSKTCLFERILTDIGDNQSIENHLSTYSYRLKNMNYFLKKCNENSLFLIDEFGTGSDPELGGALAETFLEEFYHRKAFGVITTHYANLKMLANELPYATNANMLFNDKTLEPIFKLIVGEAGSSFTFEVAQKNGIPFGLINRAKKKIEHGKVRFDATIAKLQKERSKMEKTSEALKDEEIKAREEAKRLEELNQKIKSKLINYQELYDYNQRMIALGNKINDLAEKYFENGKKRPLISEFLRIVETENSKRKKVDEAEKIRHKELKKETEKELSKKIEEIRKQRKAEKKEKALKVEKEKQQMQRALKVNDRVRIKDSRSVGSIDKIEKGKAVINYGLFTTTVDIDQLELVEKVKN